MRRVTRRVADVMVEPRRGPSAAVPEDRLNYFADAVRRSDLRGVHVRRPDCN
jgi:hypothetical protein